MAKLLVDAGAQKALRQLGEEEGRRENRQGVFGGRRICFFGFLKFLWLRTLCFVEFIFCLGFFGVS